MPPLHIPLYGEWPLAFILLGAAFLIAAAGVVGLGWYVLRGDRLNRESEMADATEPAQSEATELKH